MKSEPFDTKVIQKNLKIHAKALGIPSGAAEIFIEKALSGALKSLKSKQLVTENDINRAVVKELKQYNKDFAYVYENHDKIV